MSFISEQNSIVYINELQEDDKKIRFEQEYPYTDKDVTNILYSMLEFNPYFRKPASEIIKYDVFKKCRKDFPNLGNDAPDKIVLAYDKKNAFDYTDVFKKSD